MFHLIKNKLSINIRHHLPTEHTPTLPSQCQVNAESCKKYSTIVFAKKYDNKVPGHRKKTRCLTLFRGEGHQIAIAHKFETYCLPGL